MLPTQVLPLRALTLIVLGTLGWSWREAGFPLPQEGAVEHECETSFGLYQTVGSGQYRREAEGESFVKCVQFVPTLTRLHLGG